MDNLFTSSIDNRVWSYGNTEHRTDDYEVVTYSLDESLLIDFSFNILSMLKKVKVDRSKQQHKPAPQFSILEGVAKRTQLLNNLRRRSRLLILDANRRIEVPNKECRDMSKKLEEIEKRKKRLLEWRKEKERKKKESAKKTKPFITGIVKAPLSYVPLPPLPKVNSKEPVFQAKAKGMDMSKKDCKFANNNNTNKIKCNKPTSTLPKKNESNLAPKSKKPPSSNLVQECSKKPQMVSKTSTSQAGQSNQSKVKGIVRTKKCLDKEITKKGISKEDDSVSKFLVQLDSEVDRILQMCKSWDRVYKTSTLPNFAQELVMSATGQGRLLVSQKLKQFRSLVDSCKQGLTGAGRVTPQDLHGFWDMVYIQVEDINKRFKQLEQLKANNWKENSDENKKQSKKEKTKDNSKPQKKPAVQSRPLIRGLISKTSKKKNSMDIPVNENVENVKTFDAGPAIIHSPTKCSTLWPSPSKHKNSLLVAASSSEEPFKGQVEDINNCSGQLEQLNLEENSDESKKPSKKGKTTDPSNSRKKPAVKSRIRELILEARKAKKMSVKGDKNIDIFDAALLSIQSPTKPSISRKNSRLVAESPIKSPFREQNRVSRAILRASLIGKSVEN